MRSIEQIIFKNVEQVRCLNSLVLLKIIDENKGADGWCRLTFEEFEKKGLQSDGLIRAIKETTSLGLVKVAQNKVRIPKNGKVKRGAYPKMYRITSR